MFRSARIKLTGWYLLIIMSISVVFSLVIYNIIKREVERGFRGTEMHFRAEGWGVPGPLWPRFSEEVRRQLVEELEAAKRRVALNLVVINGVILGVSAAAGYFLAGKTLGPIEKAMEEQKRFVADASHELRTPLTALKTSIEVTLREKKITVAEAKKALQSSLEEIDSLEVLANNLLGLAQYQQGNNNFMFQPIKVDEVIQTAYKKVVPLAKKKGIEIEFKMAKQMIEANQQALEEMMVIFLDNAVKYTPKGGRVRVRTEPGKKKLMIKIEDTGVGIAQKDLPHIFDRFYRVDQSRSKDSVSGFGLGLALAKKIIEIHKGMVEVASVLGKGTSFTVKLPLKHS